MMSSILSPRKCSAMVRINGNDQRISWEEPLAVLAVSKLKTPCKVSLDAGQYLVIPLAYKLSQCPPATVRLLAGEVVSTPTRAHLQQENIAGRRYCYANYQALLVLTIGQFPPLGAPGPTAETTGRGKMARASAPESLERSDAVGLRR